MAIYNPYYPNAYSVPYPQQYQTQTNNVMANNLNSSIIWVQGEAGAKSYLVSPNHSIALFDSEQRCFYIKSADNAGMPTLRKFEYKEVNENVAENVQNAPTINFNELLDKYVTKDELHALMAKFEPRTETKKSSKKEAVKDDE